MTQRQLQHPGGSPRFFPDVYQRQPDLTICEQEINRAPGLIAQDAAGQTLAAISFALSGARIGEIWVVRNPDRLTT